MQPKMWALEFAKENVGMLYLRSLKNFEHVCLFHVIQIMDCAPIQLLHILVWDLTGLLIDKLNYIETLLYCLQGVKNEQK